MWVSKRIKEKALETQCLVPTKHVVNLNLCHDKL